MSKYFIALLLVLCSCGKKIEGVIDPAFQSYVQDFEFHVGVPVNGVSISFKPQEYPVLGVCITGGEISKIEIDPVQWDKMDSHGREQLVYHELGHCVLGRDHDNRTSQLNNTMVEGSIMNAYWFGNAWNYIKYRQQYKIGLKNNDVVHE